jgi:hypothetical protein
MSTATLRLARNPTTNQPVASAHAAPASPQPMPSAMKNQPRIDLRSTAAFALFDNKFVDKTDQRQHANASKCCKQIIHTLVLLFLFFAGVNPAFGAWAILDAFTTATGEDCDPCTANFTLSAGSNRKYVCAIGAEDGATVYDISGVTYGAVAMSLAAQAQSPTDNNIVEIWYLDEASLPANGSNALSVNFTEAVTDVGMTCGSISGISSGIPSDTDTSASDSASTATLSLTAAASDLVLTAATGSIGTSTWTHGASQTERADFTFGATPSGAMSVSTGSGVTGPSSTMTNGPGRFAMVAAVWAEAAAAPSVIPAGAIFFP